MSELNVAAVLTPKPEKFDEVAALVTEVTKQVQENEPNTLLYYAFQDKTEIIIVERYKDQRAVQAHTKAPYFRDFAAKLPGLLAKPWELRAGGFLNGARGVSRL
ncbi:uncharacterized protein N7477_006599 [Penicillium maclennaniae]|uniref:uncharacterized protein n=1 Tax=Penicillium maclennaniae TaxID=1343394 RepID=UPI0025426308|nr:uncharacterized protein N7477_006599 [Penicillium maclennaniae]KAJ5668029.1 hypothetical protein N7477_006599 [Penicillium maclennaniae]